MKKVLYISFLSLICASCVQAARVTLENATNSAVVLRMKTNAHHRDLLLEKGETSNDFPENDYELCLVREVDKMMSTGAPMRVREEFACKKIPQSLVKDFRNYGFKIVEYATETVGTLGPQFTYEIEGPIQK
jgi:hypothetical protein